ncbi:MAG TPA: hypothetical protein PK997_06795 [Candidatus Omnitrophota bacterium]|jgi:hypothetical protein|nr:MAG: hypothetical protein BWY49_00960 [Candidatus Omnitrophica bacterium ADurb.Bin314]HOE68326.1 hypothetical protein [Candidatus Omnitrophota bacterium]HPW64740.1 hypothetical protein [Candidatus Omnitrophota bacterium]HQB94899.1 hypothetical protein [Candidatus Omnitrophota bacterium]
MKKILCAFLALSVLTSATPVFANFDNFQKSPWTEEKTYVDKSVGKLAFGLTNITAGWTALFFETAKHGNIFAGIAKGVWRTGTNTVGGVLHAATFPVAVDIPLPDGGVKFE